MAEATGRSLKAHIIESMIAGAVGGILGVVIQRLIFGHTKNLMAGVIVAIILDVLWQLGRKKAKGDDPSVAPESEAVAEAADATD